MSVQNVGEVIAKCDLEFETARDYEISSGEKTVSVVGRLKHHYSYWETQLKASSFVLNVIKNGYFIPFTSHPTKFYAKNNSSSLRHDMFVKESIQKLLTNKCILEVNEQPFCCNPLTVAEKSKLRLVIDLRHVNTFIKKSTFKYEDLQTLTEMYEQNDFFFTFDLRSGYHHIQIHESHQKYLGFHWVFDGKIRYFIFLVLPFGLSSACYVFSKILRPLVHKWRGQGFKSIIFVDDGSTGLSSFELASQAAQVVQSDLLSSGFIINFEKSDFIPKQIGVWLGTIVNTIDMKLFVPEEKINKLLSRIENILLQKFTSAKQISQITGHLSSMHMSLGPVVRFFTRALYKDIENRETWNSAMCISSDSVCELKFWLQNLKNKNGFSFKHRPVATKIMFTDASNTGYGGFICERLGQKVCVGKFSPDEQNLSSTARELLAVQNVLSSFGNILAGESVQVNVDNQNVTRILTVGSSKTHLQKIAVNIFEQSLKNDILIIPKWIPRKENSLADFYSRYDDTDDWSIDTRTFIFIQSKFGPFTIDRFSDNVNRKLPRFNSKHFCPESLCVNAFTDNWSGENNWLCPPVSLVGSVIKHLKLCKACGTLLVPIWKSSYFWPLIYPNGLHFATFIKDFCVVKPYLTSSCENSVFIGKTNFDFIALKIDCS